MDKEKATRDLSVKVQPSLFEKFSQKCKKNYRSVSDVVRELMAFYVAADSPTIELIMLTIESKKLSDNAIGEPTKEELASWTPKEKELYKMYLSLK